MKLFFIIDRTLEKISIYLLVTSIIFIFLFSLCGIILRWFQVSYEWLDPLTRHLVFFSAFFAGVLTTGKCKHIAIDLLSKSLEKHQNILKNVQRIIFIVSFATLLWLSRAGYDFFLSEKEFGKIDFLGIHSSFWTLIIPIGFILMAYRFLCLFLKTFTKDECVC